VSRALDPVVPPPLREALAAEPDPAAGFTVLVLGVVDGWAHQAMVSVGELVALDERRLVLALWPASTMARALSETGRATFSAVVGATSYAVRADVHRRADVRTPLAGTLACFEARVHSATAGEAPYATLRSGVRFTLNDPEETLARWREVRAALLAGGDAP
jgi:hypothetical protein